MQIYIRNLNTNKGDWIDITPMTDFDSLDEAIASISKGDDWEMTDTDNDTDVPSDLIKGPKDALAIVLLKDEGVEDIAIKLVAEYQGGIDCTDEGDVKQFKDKCDEVQVYQSKDHFIEDMLENMNAPDFFKTYFDDEKWFRDFDIDLDGSWEEDGHGGTFYLWQR